MNISNSNSPIARREALADRLEQLTRMIEIRCVEERIQKLFAEGHVRGSDAPGERTGGGRRRHRPFDRSR